MDKALIAMSGGVDSSVAAWMVKAAGYDCTGAMMKLFSDERQAEGCCMLEDAVDARAAAHRLDIPFYVLNLQNDFKEKVIHRFIKEYFQGRTPNPCIDCNRFVKFDSLLSRADVMGHRYLVTGHYACIAKDSGSDRYLLNKAKDDSKDQSYVLYNLTQQQLSRTLFPLGEFYKTQVRAVARQQGFLNAEKRDSQDLCFVMTRQYDSVIEQYAGIQHTFGRFVDEQGNDLGPHRGIHHYTIGQRRRLGISSLQPLYVKSINPRTNTITLANIEALYSKTLTATGINLIATDRLTQPIRATAQIRYRQCEQPARVWQMDEDTIRVEFDENQRAITKGQAVVLYDGRTVIGGGTIA